MWCLSIVFTQDRPIEVTFLTHNVPLISQKCVKFSHLLCHVCVSFISLSLVETKFLRQLELETLCKIVILRKVRNSLSCYIYNSIHGKF
jgi:hypothetical protein